MKQVSRKVGAVAGVRGTHEVIHDSTKQVLFVTNLIPSRQMRDWVDSIRRRAGALVAYATLPDGSHEISAFGDTSKVKAAMFELLPTHDVKWMQAHEAKLGRKPSQPIAPPRADWMEGYRPPAPSAPTKNTVSILAEGTRRNGRMAARRESGERAGKVYPTARSFLSEHGNINHHLS